PREGSHQIRDKAWATAQLESAGLGASGTLALICLGDGPALAAAEYPVLRTGDAVSSFLAGAPTDGIVIKPMRGGGGENVMVFRSADGRELLRFDRTTIS